jgi:hypothetical protein
MGQIVGTIAPDRPFYAHGARYWLSAHETDATRGNRPLARGGTGMKKTSAITENW